jgi:primosomal protein DnaI
LIDVAACRRKCEGCTDFTACWRVGDARGRIATLRIDGDRIAVEHPICQSRIDHERRERQAYLLRESGLTDEDRNYRFRNFPEAQFKRHETIVRTAQDFGTTYNGGQARGSYFAGPPGIGKTHLMLAILNACIGRGIHVIFDRADAIKDRLHAAAKSKDEHAVRELIDLYSTVPLLAIDEYAQEPLNDHWLQWQIDILNTRYRLGLPTLFTSNFDPVEVYENYMNDAREKQILALRSRIYAMARLMFMTGEDNRITYLGDALGPEEVDDGV